MSDANLNNTEVHQLPEKREWIFFAGQAKRSSARRALAYRLSETSQVVIVRQPISLLRNGGKSPKLSTRILKQDSSGRCIEYSPIHYPERVPLIGKWLKAYGRHRLTAELDELLDSHNGAKRIVCFDSPNQYTLVGKLNEDLSVYLAIDDRTVTVWGAPIAGEVEAERKLLERVDHVVCVSETLANTLRARAGKRHDLKIDVLTNGYDDRLFNTQRKWEEPAKLRAVPHPRILISGHVSERIDWDGIRAAARLRPTWSWVFVGPADDGMKERIASIQSETRAVVVLFEPVSHEDVPAWIAHSDICAVPYRLNNFTLASSPLKAIEYLGSGAPVFSTEIPSLKPFSEVIFWVKAGDGGSYAAALDSFDQREPSGAAAIRRQTAVQGEAWGDKAQQFSDLLRMAS